MRIFLSGILLLLFLNSSTEIHQLFRIPQLAEHFRMHQQESPSLNFLEFLADHYSEPIDTDEDASDDQELPFKNFVDSHHVLIVIGQPVEVFNFECPVLINNSQTVHQESFPVIYPSPIFHPPGTC
jgi:hypothetical protein